MSGVYINGMKMPKNCEKCLYLSWSNFYQIYVCNAVRKNEPVLFDGKQTKITSCVRSARADNCPLVPVPPHGDLIDRNKLYEKTAEWEAQALHMVEVTMYDEDTAEWRKWSTVLTERSAFKFDVANAPTIIEAEEGE